MKYLLIIKFNLFIKFIYNISYKLINNSNNFILIIYYLINLLPSFYEFIPVINISSKFNIDLKNVIPSENISFFSGLNYPIPYPI